MPLFDLEASTTWARLAGFYLLVLRQPDYQEHLVGRRLSSLGLSNM